MRIDGYYWVKHPIYGWHVGQIYAGAWSLPVGPSFAGYTDKDFDQISSRIKNPDELECGASAPEPASAELS